MKTTPARTKKAKEQMAEVESYVRELVHRLREGGVLDRHPEIAALVDEAGAQIAGLRRARVDL